jgi:hypothetical protein
MIALMHHTAPLLTEEPHMDPTHEQIQAGLEARRQHEYSISRTLKVTKGRHVLAHYCLCGQDISAWSFWDHQMEEILKAVFNLQAEENRQRLASEWEGSHGDLPDH